MSTGIDERWYSQLASIIEAMGEVYVALEPSPESLYRERIAFDASGHVQLPNLYPDRIQRDTYLDIQSRLQQLEAEVSVQETNNHVRTAYLEVMAFMKHNTTMILAALGKDYAAMNHENQALYNVPDHEVFAAVCDWIRRDATATIVKDNPHLQTLKNEVLRKIPHLNGRQSLLIPDEIVFNTVRDLHFAPGSYFDKLFGKEGLPTMPYITQEEGDSICNRLLKNIGSDFTLADSDINIWATMRDKKLIVRPPGYRLDRDEFIGIVSHEIGTHLLHMANGNRQTMRLLGLGMAGYEYSDEGRAFLREQIVYDKESTFLRQFAWEYIVLLHLSVSLAQGLNGHRYQFPELYDTLFCLYSFWRERRMPRATNNEAYARDEAWMLAVRIYKGTDGTDGSYMKDIVYLEGNIKSWQLAKTDPSLILRGDVGRFDITNPQQVAMLNELGILPVGS
jgi:hypothetical protein